MDMITAVNYVITTDVKAVTRFMTRARRAEEGVINAVLDTADQQDKTGPPAIDKDGDESRTEEGSKDKSYLNPDKVDDGV
jgi:hypothetical protein